MKQTLLFSCILLVLIGCAPSGPKRYAISGTVTYNGEIFPHGSIVFTPDASRGNSGPQASTSIIDGGYDTGKFGPIAGPMIVEISGVHGLYKDGPSGPGAVPLFSDYEERFEMPAEPFEKNFDITGPKITIIR